MPEPSEKFPDFPENPEGWVLLKNEPAKALINGINAEFDKRNPKIFHRFGWNEVDGTTTKLRAGFSDDSTKYNPRFFFDLDSQTVPSEDASQPESTQLHRSITVLAVGLSEFLPDIIGASIDYKTGRYPLQGSLEAAVVCLTGNVLRINRYHYLREIEQRRFSQQTDETKAEIIREVFGSL